MAVKDSNNSFLDKNQLKTYLTDQGTPEERENWEDVLLEDEEALSLYMEMLDEFQEELPELEDQASFVNKVMVGMEGRIIVNEPRRAARNPWYQRPIFHYIVAASLTLLFMSSGVFDRLMTGKMDVVLPKDSGLSYSEQVMEKTSGWFEQLMNDGNR